MNLAQYIDATYLKTADQANISEAETLQNIFELTDFSIQHNAKAVMIRPEYVKQIKAYIISKQSEVKVGTVIDFPLGTSSTAIKLNQAKKAITDNADELDFVIDYKAFIKGEILTVENQFIQGTALALAHNKTVKWIIETAALSETQIIEICKLFKNAAEKEFPNQMSSIFVKTSTGFYKTNDYSANGATIKDVKLMLTHAFPLPIKASGGIKTKQQAQKFIELGVLRLGASSQELF